MKISTETTSFRQDLRKSKRIFHKNTHGAVASLASVAKLPFEDSQDGISNTFSIIPNALGKDEVFMGDLDLDLHVDLDCGCCSTTIEEKSSYMTPLITKTEKKNTEEIHSKV